MGAPLVQVMFRFNIHDSRNVARIRHQFAVKIVLYKCFPSASESVSWRKAFFNIRPVFI